MAKKVLPDKLWTRLEPILPRPTKTPKGGRPRVDDRKILTGILFILKNRDSLGILAGRVGLRKRNDLLATPSGLAKSGSLEETPPTDSGRTPSVWIDRLGKSIPGFVSHPGKKGGEETGPNPVDRGRPGSKHHILVDGGGVPLGIAVGPANQHDSRMLEEMLDVVPPIRGKGRGRPRRRPRKLHADKGYDYTHCRRVCRLRGIKPRIAHRGIESSERLGRFRWVVEQTIAWLHRYRRILVRFERRADIHLGFLSLAIILININFL